MPEIIDHEDIDGAIGQLAASLLRAGYDTSPTKIRNVLTEPGSEGAGFRDPLALSKGIAALAQEMTDAGIALCSQSEAEQELALSGPGLTAEGRRYVQDENGEWVPAEDGEDPPGADLASRVQRELAAAGTGSRETRFALSDTDPWTAGMDEADRALVSVHRRAIAAGPGYRKHFEGMLKINPALAGLLGLAADDGDDDGDGGDGDGGDGDGMSAGDEAARIIARQAHTGLFGSTSPRDGAAHTAACSPDCATDHRQNRKAVTGTSGHSEVDAVVGRHQGLGMFGTESPISGNARTGAGYAREADRH